MLIRLLLLIFILYVEKYIGKGAFLLCKTSNPGSNEFMTLPLLQKKLKTYNDDELLYERIASLVSNEWSNRCPSNSLLGLVVGATDPDAIRRVRKICDTNSNNNNKKDIWILAPGVGTQGGQLKDTIVAGMNPINGYGLLIPISRSISQSSNILNAANEIHEQIKLIRTEMMQEYHNEQRQEKVEQKNTTSSLLQSYQREFVEFCLQQNVLKFGSYTLKSGRISPYFFNAGLFDNGSALYTLATSYATTIVESISKL